MDGRLAALRQVDLFASVADDDLAVLGATLRRRRYPKGAALYYEGDPGHGLYLIESGTVKLSLSSSDGREDVLALVGPGEYIGDLALLDGDPHAADAVAKDDCEVLLLQRAEFLRFLAGRAAAAAELLATLSRRLRRNTPALEETAFLGAPGRVAGAILELAESHGHPSPEGTVIPAELTQGELPSLAGTTKDSAGRWLRFFERQGWLRWHAGRITVLRPDDLQRRAG